MTRYVLSRDNLRILMNLMRVKQDILVANKSKFLRLLGDLKIDNEDDQFEPDKAQVMKEISALEPKE
ncbi:calcium-binding protein [Medicago truncatula]|uniref:Calcium-binding protein n=1 Tax=Medicago truncatula TaxID=3880 RepID=G7JJH3_MEDTR|nr:calcium-binding protein [Medicago truncatula]